MENKRKKIFLKRGPDASSGARHGDDHIRSEDPTRPAGEIPSGTVIRYGAGLDVHKDKIAVCVMAQTEEGTLTEVHYHVFSSTPRGLNDLCRFLDKYRPIGHYLMECTGVYHLPVMHALRDAFPEYADRIVAMNPLMVHRRLSEFGNKNDHADARKMAALSFYDALIRPSYVGTSDYHALRSLIRAYHHHKEHMTRIRNRITRNLHSINIRCPLQLSLKWALELLDNFIAGEWTLGEAYHDLIERKRAEGKGVAVLENQRSSLLPYFDIRLPDAMRWELRLELANFLHERRVASILLVRSERYILKDDELYADYIALHMIPGVSSVSAITILLELGDYRRFSGIDAFVKFCGVVPTVFESAEYRSKGHINRFTNKYLRKTLTQCASILLNARNRHTDLGDYAYRQRFERNLPYKKALMKVANKLARTIYHVLVLRIPYDPMHELRQTRRIRLMRSLRRKGTLLESPYIRAIRDEMKNFAAKNSDFLRARSKWFLRRVFDDMIIQAERQFPGFVFNLRKYPAPDPLEVCRVSYDMG